MAPSSSSSTFILTVPDLLAHIPRGRQHMLIHTCASESICQAAESGWNSLELKFLRLGTAMSCEPRIRDAQRLPD